MITRFARDLRREGLTRGFFIHTGRVTSAALDNAPQGIVILSPVDLVRWIGK
jgi:restriction endonuclease Mrr